MHQLQCASQPASLDSIASEERVLSVACSILAQRGHSGPAERCLCEASTWPLLPCPDSPQGPDARSASSFRDPIHMRPTGKWACAQARTISSSNVWSHFMRLNVIGPLFCIIRDSCLAADLGGGPGSQGGFGQNDRQQSGPAACSYCMGSHCRTVTLSGVLLM